MAEQLTEKQVRHVALLARLECSDEEIHQFAGELNSILEYADKIQEVDTDGIEPTSHAVRLSNVFRDDVVRPSLSNDEALANAPDAEAGHFKVPPIIQEF